MPEMRDDDVVARRRRWHFFYTSKPYSYASEISRGLAFLAVLGTPIQMGNLALVAVQTLAMWLFFNWQSDRIQGDPGRVKPPTVLVVLPGVTSAAIGWWLGGLWGIGGVLAYAVCIWVYALKAKSRILGPLGPALRTATVVGQFLMIWALAGTTPSHAAWWVVGALAVWKGVRNLIGDVRDVRTDTHEIPARFGVHAAVWTIRAGELVAVAALLASDVPGNIAAAVIVISAWAILELLRAQYASAEAYKWGYATHRIYVLTAVALHLVLGIAAGVPAMWGYWLTALALFLQPTYGRLPGKRFPRWGELKPTKPSKGITPCL